MQNSANRVNMLQLCAQDIAANADKLLADVPYYQDCDIVIGIGDDDVPYYQDCDIMIGLRDDEAPFVKVVQRYVPEKIVRWYNKENN